MTVTTETYLPPLGVQVREEVGGESVESLPRSPNGKVLKRKIRARYWTGRTTRI